MKDIDYKYLETYNINVGKSKYSSNNKICLDVHF